MDLITIGGVALPAPESYDVKLVDIAKSDRNAAGNLIIERIATKRQIELGWGRLSGTEYSAILNAVDPVFFSVTYFDPKANALKTGTFCCGDRQAPMMFFVNGAPEWKDIKLSLTER